jgi:hypothetical protein
MPLHQLVLRIIARRGGASPFRSSFPLDPPRP